MPSCRRTNTQRKRQTGSPHWARWACEVGRGLWRPKWHADTAQRNATHKESRRGRSRPSPSSLGLSPCSCRPKPWSPIAERAKFCRQGKKSWQRRGSTFDDDTPVRLNRIETIRKWRFGSGGWPPGWPVSEREGWWLGRLRMVDDEGCSWCRGGFWCRLMLADAS
jgi:hypothetical protein